MVLTGTELLDWYGPRYCRDESPKKRIRQCAHRFATHSTSFRSTGLGLDKMTKRTFQVSVLEGALLSTVTV
jgi:hypothetical protein